jgi:hypothetical protein
MNMPDTIIYNHHAEPRPVGLEAPMPRRPRHLNQYMKKGQP